jgi:hypothetical protein
MGATLIARDTRIDIIDPAAIHEALPPLGLGW